MNSDMRKFLEENNLKGCDTGGGCTALTNDWDCGTFYWLITEDGDAFMPQTIDEPVCVGLYNDQLGNDIVAWWKAKNMVEAMELIKKTHLG